SHGDPALRFVVRAGPPRQRLEGEGQPGDRRAHAHGGEAVQRSAPGEGGRARRRQRERARRSARRRRRLSRTLIVQLHNNGASRARPELVLVGVTVLWGSTFIITKDIVREAP